MEPTGTSTPVPIAGEQSGKSKQPPQEPWLTGPRRAMLVLALGALCIINVVVMFIRIQPPRAADTTVHCRPGGAGIPLFQNVTGDERVHVLRPGDEIAIENPRHGNGTRLPAWAKTADGLEAHGFVDAKDLVPEELERLKALYDAASSH